MEEVRASGRSTRLLSMTPQRGLFITNHSALCRYIRDWAKQNGQDIKVYAMNSLSAISDALRGKRNPVVVLDHTVAEMASREEWEDLWELFHRASRPCQSFIVIYMDPDGAIKVWNKQ